MPFFCWFFSVMQISMIWTCPRLVPQISPIQMTCCHSSYTLVQMKVFIKVVVSSLASRLVSIAIKFSFFFDNFVSMTFQCIVKYAPILTVQKMCFIVILHSSVKWISKYFIYSNKELITMSLSFFLSFFLFYKQL